MRTIIIGGVAGGATAAARLRRLDENMEIILIERGDYISYANCGLPYYIGDVIKGRDALLLQTPEAMKAKFNIDVRVGSEVIAINKEAKTLTVKSDNTYEVGYDYLIIATGSSPLRPPIPGIDGDNIYTLWTIPDTDRIREIVDNKRPSTAAVIGGGFIGLEMAENLAERGIKVSLVEAQNQVMAPIDFEMAQLLHENMDMNQVRLYLGDGVKSFVTNDTGTTVELVGGTKIEVDIVILAIGVRPNGQLAMEAGIATNARGGIKVDSYMSTSESDIWAVGDVVEIHNIASGELGMIPLAGPANKQGRIVADNIAAKARGVIEPISSYRGSLGTSVAKVFDLSVATVGVNEKYLIGLGKIKNKDYYVALINQKSHAGYYPEATPLTLKMIFDGGGKILGAQIVGQDGVDKRIDTIATTMRLGGSIYDLMELELAYAPPYSSAKDPVNMLGFVADNILKGLVNFISWNEVSEEYLILDVTEDMERTIFSIEGSYHIPLGQLRNRLDEVPRDRNIATYCSIGVRSYNAARILMQSGYDRVNVIAGGTGFYKSNHYIPTVIKDNVNKQDEAMEDIVLKDNDSSVEVKILDCCGLQCPGPIMKVNETLQVMRDGETLRVSATDMGFAKDVESWCERTGNTFLGKERIGKENIVTIQKGGKIKTVNTTSVELPQGKSIIVFDGDMDKVLASFIIANGAAAMGRPVTMFFTFWGLNALRKPQKQNIRKPFIEKMFGMMMPRGASKLQLSNMNMCGMGTKMMKYVMAKKNVSSLETLIEQAVQNGVRLVACTMSMDVMGIREEELIDGVEFAGVASYLADAENANVNLFI